MTDLSAFPITKRWPAKHPDVIQLYSLPTPNGVKVSIMLEEIGLPYEPHCVDIGKNESWTPEFLSLNPNGKIPAIIDPNGPGGKPLGLFESGAILVYLADKTGKLHARRRRRPLRDHAVGVLPDGGRSARCSARSASSTSSPARSIEDKRPLKRYRDEVEAPARRARDAPRRPRTGSWATTTPSPTSRCSAGCAT